jgi:hypothetical protein
LIIAPLSGAQDVCSIVNKGYHIRKHISERQQQNSTALTANCEKRSIFLLAFEARLAERIYVDRKRVEA